MYSWVSSAYKLMEDHVVAVQQEGLAAYQDIVNVGK